MIAGQGLDPTGNPHVVSVMNALLFAYLPVGLFGRLLAVAVKSNPALVGLSSGFILGHFLLPTVIGGVVNVVKSGESLGGCCRVSIHVHLQHPCVGVSLFLPKGIYLYTIFFCLV